MQSPTAEDHAGATSSSGRARLLETFWLDVRYGLRNLTKHPGFTLIVVLTMALGIGANTAIFSVVNGVLLKALPYEHGDRLVIVRQQRPLANIEDTGFSVKEIVDYRTQSKTLDGLAEYHNMWFILLGRGEPQRVSTGVVSADFFNMVGVKPLLGRTFVADDDKTGADAVLVLSHPYWQRAFGGDPSVVGQVFQMNDRPHTVVGVLPPIPQYPQEDDVYMPTTACPFRSRQALVDNRDGRMVNALARLKPGATLQQCHSDLNVVARQLQQTYPESYPKETGYQAAVVPLQQELTQGFRPTLLILLGTAGFVLLIVCASVANLTLARMVHREREMAVRAALGAGRGRLLRQMLTESTLLALAGGVLGLILASAGLDLLVTFAARFTTRAGEIGIDAPVLLFTLGLSLATGLVFGSLPGLRARQDIVPALRDGGGRATAGGQRLRNGLIVVQVAVSFMLLVGAGLMLRSLVKLHQVDPGFKAENVLTMRVALNFTKYTTGQLRSSFYERLVERLGAVPGIVNVAGSGTFPLNEGGTFQAGFRVEGRTVPEGTALPRSVFSVASPDYFKTMGIPLLKGRGFTSQDTFDSPGVVIVNQSMAKHYWTIEDPIGRRISTGADQPWLTIVGVIGDVRQQLNTPPEDEFYRPLLQAPLLQTSFLVRSNADASGLARQVRVALDEIDPDQPIEHFRTLEQVRAESLASPRLTTILLGLFAALALVVTSAGISGVIAFSVNQRTQEFGIRMALGAERRTVLFMVLRQGLSLVAIGLGLGAAGALVLARVMSSLLFEVETTDVLTYVGVSFVLVGVAAVACLMPARRASSVNPMVVLRTT